MHVVLILLSLTGLYVSLYFSFVYYGFVKPDTKYVPAFCQMEKEACQLVMRHPDARILGVPNSLMGIGYYLFVILVGAGIETPLFISLMRFASWLSVILAVYLVYSLLFRVKVLCPLCLISHGANLVIAMLLTFWW